MKVLVCGSRDWTDHHAILNALIRHAPLKIMHGAARGADRIAADLAELHDIEAQAFLADWEHYGKRAGILRNLQMLNAQPNLVIAFQCNGSCGTQHTIDEAQRRGIPVEVHRC